jgi:hypothetical protein
MTRKKTIHLACLLLIWAITTLVEFFYRAETLCFLQAITSQAESNQGLLFVPFAIITKS